MLGRVVKGIGGFYYVDDGEHVYMGNARKNLKRGKSIIYVGDIVEFDLRQEDGDCIITNVRERKNFLSRPPVSNLDKLVVVFAAASPDPNRLIIDKFTAATLYNNIEVIICITKPDLVAESDLLGLVSTYEKAFPVVTVNGKTGDGIDELFDLIKGSNVAFAGPSGVGKSTIMNSLTGRNDIKTGDISSKTSRGRHTTRHVEIFSIDKDTYFYDTPGFTSLDMPKLGKYHVRDYFPEIAGYKGYCKYLDCIHVDEPDCAVKDALAEGQISKSRYESYLAILEEVRKWQR
ncbi:ribosome small subunit-dependent GTPase A [Mogibacterium pumilum]|uniref:Small ribosomal subunit biogenesis GTPase RsgA n=1 Tax=Mogibacterium pumilum TaxID=86332 RepID=A0A223ASW3_9FIRM|nr:ribosome small subunit-dependent GTPase A [Mogibacterium pumilum]ASS38057.1 ribosome small subunit-dependent GTPase A [Mogibacterium pumilum]